MIDLTRYDRMKQGLKIIFENPHMNTEAKTFAALLAMSGEMRYLAEEINKISEKAK